MNAHVKRQHPDMDIPKRLTRNLPKNGVRASLVTPTKTEGLYTDLINTQNEEICACKYYNFVSFLINNGINIEKRKENVNLLKKIVNLK